MWINITTLEQSGRYEVEMNTKTGFHRHRKLFGIGNAKDWIIVGGDEWKSGDPPTANKGMNADTK